MPPGPPAAERPSLSGNRAGTAPGFLRTRSCEPSVSTGPRGPDSQLSNSDRSPLRLAAGLWQPVPGTPVCGLQAFEARQHPLPISRTTKIRSSAPSGYRAGFEASDQSRQKPNLDCFPIQELLCDLHRRLIVWAFDDHGRPIVWPASEPIKYNRFCCTEASPVFL